MSEDLNCFVHAGVQAVSCDPLQRFGSNLSSPLGSQARTRGSEAALYQALEPRFVLSLGFVRT